MPTNETDAQRHEDNQRRMAEMEQRLAGTEQQLASALAAITRLDARSQETLDGVGAIRALFAQLDIPALREMADAMNTMKGGVRVLGWLERPAKWIAAIAGAVLAVYGLLKLKG